MQRIPLRCAPVFIQLKGVVGRSTLGRPLAVGIGQCMGDHEGRWAAVVCVCVCVCGGGGSSMRLRSAAMQGRAANGAAPPPTPTSSRAGRGVAVVAGASPSADLGQGITFDDLRTSAGLMVLDVVYGLRFVRVTFEFRNSATNLKDHEHESFLRSERVRLEVHAHRT
jgi:hypothetical protein